MKNVSWKNLLLEKLEKKKVLDYVMDVAFPLITEALEQESEKIDVGKLVDDLVSDPLLQVFEMLSRLNIFFVRNWLLSYSGFRKRF